MKNLRTHGKSTIVWLLLGLLILGLGGFGVTNFTGGSSAIGSVGDTEITADDYARGLSAEMRAYSQQTGQPFTMAQAQSIGLPQSVQARLFAAATLAEEANRIGVSVGDDEVGRSIREAQAFRGPNGNFDRTAYTETLRREGISVAQFENDVREDAARLILQRAVAGGIAAPEPMIDQTAKWILETRDLTWRELTADELPQPIADPDQATLEAWHQANADRFTAPETRKLTYVWLTPEMLADTVELDDKALRDLYETRKSEFQQPERRMVARLVMPDQATADAAKARLDKGEATFAELVTERGLSLDDVDLGELTREELGDAGEAVFALTDTDVVGPIQTPLGPALFSMNAILDPIDIPFEQAEVDLRAEAAADRARRVIEDRSSEFEDMLASGASLEDIDAETPMEIGQIDWTADSQPEQGSISGYQAFRERAIAVTQDDFPQLYTLDDGGIFALRLDEIVPPTLKPFAGIRDEVLTDWRQSETHRQLIALAEDERMADETADEAEVAEAEPAAEPAAEAANTNAADATAEAPAANAEAPAADPAPQAQPATTAGASKSETGLTRDGWIDGVPPDVVTDAFAIKAPGETEIVDAENRVFLVTLDAVNDADLAGEEAKDVRGSVESRLSQSLQGDVFEYFTRAVQMRAGVRINDSVLNAVNAQVQ